MRRTRLWVAVSAPAVATMRALRAGVSSGPRQRVPLTLVGVEVLAAARGGAEGDNGAKDNGSVGAS